MGTCRCSPILRTPLSCMPLALQLKLLSHQRPSSRLQRQALRSPHSDQVGKLIAPSGRCRHLPPVHYQCQGVHKWQRLLEGKPGILTRAATAAASIAPGRLLCHQQKRLLPQAAIKAGRFHLLRSVQSLGRRKEVQPPGHLHMQLQPLPRRQRWLHRMDSRAPRGHPLCTQLPPGKRGRKNAALL